MAGDQKADVVAWHPVRHTAFARISLAPHSVKTRDPPLLSAGLRPALQVVSFHADDTNRGPTFDVELSDLLQPDGSPISYRAARAYFQQDPAHR